jgi:hypothetical protein
MLTYSSSPTNFHKDLRLISKIIRCDKASLGQKNENKKTLRNWRKCLEEKKMWKRRKSCLKKSKNIKLLMTKFLSLQYPPIRGKQDKNLKKHKSQTMKLKESEIALLPK